MLAVIWHYWLGVAVAAGAVAALVALVAGYLKTVETSRHPKER